MSDFEHQDEKEFQERSIENIISAYHRIFSGPDARIVLPDLMKFCHVFNGTDNDVEEGKRMVALYILRMSGVEAKIKKLIEEAL